MIELKNISKKYQTVTALNNISLTIQQGEFTTIKGASGSGKTTLLMTLGGLLKPDTGTLSIMGTPIYNLSASKRTQFRAQNIGFVFQMFHLLPYLNAIDNTLLPFKNQHSKKRQEAIEILKRLGLGHRLYHKPAQMSTGERQRNALARALLCKPSLLLADEPTGNLDPQNAKSIIEILSEYHKQGGTIILVTHGEEATPFADKTILLNQGQLQ